MTITDSGATSGIGTSTDPCPCMGHPSNKQFTLPNGTIVPATELAQHPFKVQPPANELHITPSIIQHSLLSTVKFTDANYITVFDKELVNVYDTNDTVSLSARAQSYVVFATLLLTSITSHIPLVDMVQNNNTNTIIISCLPTEFLLDHPSPQKDIHNVFELRTQPELICYNHASARFPTKPTWLAAIKNNQFSSWPGLTMEAARKHFPDSEEMHKGHSRKTPSGPRSTKT